MSRVAMGTAQSTASVLARNTAPSPAPPATSPTQHGAGKTKGQVSAG